jgi:hypothetical protein
MRVTIDGPSRNAKIKVNETLPIGGIERLGFALLKKTKNRREFMRKVEILWIDEYLEFELENLPTTVNGGFAPWRVEEFLKLARLHPEFHIVTCIEPSLYINAFVKGGMTYHLAEGDPDPRLVFDQFDKLDQHYLHLLNSGQKEF